MTRLSPGRGVNRHRRNTSFSRERQATRKVDQKALSTSRRLTRKVALKKHAVIVDGKIGA